MVMIKKSEDIAGSKTEIHNEYLLTKLHDFQTFSIFGLKDLLKKYHKNDNIQDIYFAINDENQCLRDFLVSKLDGLGLFNDIAFSGTIVYSDGKRKDIIIKIEALEVKGLFYDQLISSLCYSFLNIKNSSSQQLEINVLLNETNVPACDKGAVIINAHKGCWLLPEILNQLSYIFEKLDIPVIKDENRCELKIHPVGIALLTSDCYVFELLRKQSQERIVLTKIQQLCANYLGHTYKVSKELFPLARSILNEKENVIKKIYYASTLLEAKEILKDNHSILIENRTPTLVAILETLALILTSPISMPVMLAKRGSLNFFKSHSQLFAEEVETKINNSLG